MALHAETEKHLLQHHENFESFAEAMVAGHGKRFDPLFWAFLEQCLSHDPTAICDFGTGPGLLLRDLQKRFPEAKISGVDAQPAMIAKFKQLMGNEFPIHVADLAHPPIKGLVDQSLDLVTCSMVLHELQVPTRLIGEMGRVLRPGGVAVIYDWVRQDLPTYFEGQLPSEIGQFAHFSEHCRYTPQDLVWLFEMNGFQVVEWVLRHNGRHILLGVMRK